MPKSIKLSDYYDLEKLHETLEKNSVERSTLPALDVTKAHKIASQAYVDAVANGEGLQGAYLRAQELLDSTE